MLVLKYWGETDCTEAELFMYHTYEINRKKQWKRLSIQLERWPVCDELGLL